MSSTVLVVEDDETIRESVAYCLRDEGYTVQEAADGKAALEVMREHQEGIVVLLDLAMPGVDGYAVVQAIELEPPLAARHACIIMSAQERTLPLAFVQQITRLNMAVLAKPFELDDLIGAVASAANSLQPPQ